MKKLNSKYYIAAIALAAAMLAGCSSEPSGKVKTEDQIIVEEKDKEPVASTEKEEAEEEKADVEEVSSVDEEIKEEAADAQAGDALAKRELKAKLEDFDATWNYINNRKEDESVNFGEVIYKPAKWNKDVAEPIGYESIAALEGTDEYKKIRFLREDKAGSTVDVSVYTNPSTLFIDEIVTEEFCADGRDVTRFYYDGGKLAYVNQYKLPIYGNLYVDESLPGKKCSFSEDAMIKCVANDADVDYKMVEYRAEDYSDFDDFTKGIFDETASNLINQAYIIYDKVRTIPGTALITGYVGDEYGGILSKVHMTLSSSEYKYKTEFETNGDGYFEVRVPINRADWYGVKCDYGNFTQATVDDINICPGTVEYSLGIIYMAEPGQNVHEPNTYLLNALEKSPKGLGKNEYCVTLTFDNGKADLKPFAMNLKNGKASSDVVTVIKADKDGQYKYYVTDQRGGKSGNPMTYEMSTSNARVKVYNSDGLVASYQVPVGKAGTVWEVFEIRDGKLMGVNNYFYETEKGPFF